MKIIQLISFLSAVILLGYLSAFSSCSKEYSCEGCSIADTIKPTDSLPGDTTIFVDTTKVDNTLNFPICNNCDSTKPLPLNSWSFKTNNSYLCGTVDYSWFDTEKYSVDFSGYLRCSKDTGFRITAFFYPLKFTVDRFNVPTSTQGFGLQDHTNYMNPWAGYILRTDFSTTPAHTIKVVVDTFNNSTKLMVGRFFGYAYTRNNEKSYVDGKFRFIVH